MIASGNAFADQVRIVSSLTRSGSSIGQSDSIVNAIRMRLEDAGNRVCGVPIVYEDLDGGSEERGSWDAAREQANARYAYDATGVILQAIERVGRLDRAAITEAAFATRDFDGLLGRWSFDANGDVDLRRGTRLTVRNGHFVPLAVLPIDE